MATIKQRIDGVTENVTDGKSNIATSINNKNAKNVNVSSNGTFLSMSNAIDKLNIEKVSKPTIKFENMILTISNSMSGVTNYYRKYNTSTWIKYNSPVDIIDEGDYQFYSSKDGSIDSDIVIEMLEDNTGVLFPTYEITLDNSKGISMRDYNGSIEIHTTPPIIDNVDGFASLNCERTVSAGAYSLWAGSTTTGIHVNSLSNINVKIVVVGFFNTNINLTADGVKINKQGTFDLGNGYITGDSISIHGTIS